MTFLSSIDCFNLTFAFLMGPPSHDVFLTVKGVGLTTLSLTYNLTYLPICHEFWYISKCVQFKTCKMWYLYVFLNHLFATRRQQLTVCVQDRCKTFWQSLSILFISKQGMLSFFRLMAAIVSHGFGCRRSYIPGRSTL